MPRATSSTATPQVWESSSAIRTRICTALVCVTRPTVLVESRFGNSALVADSLMTSMRESRSLIPRLSAASTSPARSLGVSNANRGGHRNGGHGAAEHDGNDGYDCHAGQRFDAGQQQQR